MTLKKESEFVTKTMLQEAVDAILDGMNNLAEDIKKEINLRFEENSAEHADIKHQISDLKYDTPSMKEFNDLKTKVDKNLANNPN